MYVWNITYLNYTLLKKIPGYVAVFMNFMKQGLMYDATQTCINMKCFVILGIAGDVNEAATDFSDELKFPPLSVVLLSAEMLSLRV